jgi:hypothetical protein
MRLWRQLLMTLDAKLKFRKDRTEALAKARFLAQLVRWRERLPRHELQREMDKEIIELAELMLARTKVPPATAATLDDPARLRS